MTPQGERLLKDFEGLRYKPYDDKDGQEFFPGDMLVGKLTIGWGRNLTDRGISHDEAELMFQNDIEQATHDANKLPWFGDLDAVRQDVIVMLCFNMGLGGLLTFKRMIASLVQCQWHQAAWELSNSEWKNQVGKERHDKLTNALETGRWD